MATIAADVLLNRLNLRHLMGRGTSGYDIAGCTTGTDRVALAEQPVDLPICPSRLHSQVSLHPIFYTLLTLD